MIRPPAQLTALVAGAALVPSVGCGSEEEKPGPGIPRTAADQLRRELDLVQERIDVTREQSKPGSCRDVDSKSYPDMQEILAGLPGDTDPDVRRALERSIDRLKELTESECSELIEEIEKRREESPPQVTPPPAPVQPEPAPEPTPTETQPQEKEPKEKKPKKDDDKDNGDGGVGPNDQGPPGQGGGGQPAPVPDDG
ncbi:MAG: hypothetical protein M3131_06890 [Actinomycetota bacterium]|nr:hypothetical protein [Actinomycetota bacterium]